MHCLCVISVPLLLALVYHSNISGNLFEVPYVPVSWTMMLPLRLDGLLFEGCCKPIGEFLLAEVFIDSRVATLRRSFFLGFLRIDCSPDGKLPTTCECLCYDDYGNGGSLNAEDVLSSFSLLAVSLYISISLSASWPPYCFKILWTFSSRLFKTGFEYESSAIWTRRWVIMSFCSFKTFSWASLARFSASSCFSLSLLFSFWSRSHSLFHLCASAL